MDKEIIDVNEKFEELQLSRKINNSLKRVGLITISDVIDLANTKGLGSIRNLGKKSILEIKQIILDKCNVDIAIDGYASLGVLHLSKGAFNRLINKYSVDKFEDVLDLCVNQKNSKKYLDSRVEAEKEVIDRVHELGYFFSDEKEEVFSLDDDISKLNYSKLTNINLYNYGVYTIRDLLRLSLDKNAGRKERGIYSIRGFGDKKVQELVDLMHSMGFIFECERFSNKNEEFSSEYDDSDNSKEVYNFFYENDEFNNCIFRVSKNLNNGLRNYQFYFDEQMRKKFGEVFEKDFNICNMNFEMFVYDEFNKLLYDLSWKIKNIIDGSSNKAFRNSLDSYQGSIPFHDKIFSKFRSTLNKKYIEDHIINIMNYKKSKFRNNKKFENLMSLFDRIFLFIKYEEKELILEKDNINLEILNNIKENILKEKSDIYYYIIDYYFDKNLINNSINDYAIGIVNKIIDDLEKEYDAFFKKQNKFSDLELLFELVPGEIVNKEFYHKIGIYDEFIDNKFVINFIKLVNQLCNKENGDKYSTKEIILFLQNKFYSYNDDMPKDKNKMVNGVYKLSRHL